MPRFFPDDPTPQQVILPTAVTSSLDQLSAAMQDVLRAVQALQLEVQVNPPQVDVNVDTARLATEATLQQVAAGMAALDLDVDLLLPELLNVRVAEPVELDQATLAALSDLIGEVRRSTATGQRVIAAGGQRFNGILKLDENTPVDSDNPLPVVPKGARLDADNSTFTALGADETFTGGWVPTDGLGVLSFFAFTDQPFAELRLEWSDDGENVVTGLLATTDYLPSLTETGGFQVYYPDPQTYLLRDYYRVVAVNDSVAQATLELYMWTFPTGSNPFSFLDIDSTPSTLQKALLVKSTNAALDIVSWTDADDGTIPSGSTVTIDPVLNAEANVLDSGWISTSTFAGKNIVNVLGDTSLKVFLMNASDDQGSNIFGNLAPTLDTNAGSPSQLSALYADKFYRVVVCNDSGSSLTDYSIRSEAAPESTDGITTGIGQPVFGFFPAQVVRSVIMGRQPDGDYVNTPASGAAYDRDGVQVRTETPLGAAGVYESGWVDTDGWAEIELVIATDQVSGTAGIVVEHADEVSDTTPTVRTEETFTFTAADVTNGSLTLRLAPIGDGFRVRYTNGGTPQGAFYLDATLRVDPTSLPRAPIDSTLDSTSQAVTVRGPVSAASTVDGDWDTIGRSPGADNANEGLHTYIVGSEDLPIKALSTWDSAFVSVSGIAAEVTSSTPLTGRKSIFLKSSSANNRVIRIGPTSAVSSASAALRAGEAITLDLDDTAEIWAITDSGTADLTVVEIGA